MLWSRSETVSNSFKYAANVLAHDAYLILVN